jgi:[ribosomal protein S5]-alanine N-acetyltransferase
VTPTLLTERLVLGPYMRVTKRHVEWMNDPEVTRYSENRNRTHTLKSCEKFIATFNGSKRSHIWAIRIAVTNSHIGNITCHTDEANNVTNVGILLGDKSVWGKGFGSEAWRAACDWLLDKDGGAVRKIEAGCHANNPGIVKLFQKTGMLYEGERKLHFLWNGSPVGLLFFARFK